MVIAVPAELKGGEVRIALHPESVKKLSAAEKLKVIVEKGLGVHLGIGDDEFRAAGAEVASDSAKLYAKADVVVRVNKPAAADIEKMKPGTVLISFLDPFSDPKILGQLNKKSLTAFSMEMIPRTTKAQKMDALSSQASLAGYAAVIQGAAVIRKVLPMMMTPAGTINPVRVFVIGAGVAGLQAIATAKRLGGRVEAYDTRPVVREQVESLGAKFVEFDLGETGQTSGGYAKELSAAQLKKQRDLMKKTCAAADMVITTAKLFGRKAPLLIPKETLREMKPGSVVVDLAVDSGGNVEGSAPGKTVNVGGVSVIGIANLPGTVAVDASQMYGNNIAAFLLEFYDSETGSLRIDQDDEIIKGSLVCRDGATVNEFINEKLKGDK